MGIGSGGGDVLGVARVAEGACARERRHPVRLKPAEDEEGRVAWATKEERTGERRQRRERVPRTREHGREMILGARGHPLGGSRGRVQARDHRVAHRKTIRSETANHEELVG